MISKIAFDCLQSDLLSLENLALEPSDTIKFFRGIFWSRQLSKGMRQDVTKAFMAYVREKDFTGKTWLQILDISRLGEMPESFIEEIQGKLNEVYMLSQMDLKTIDQVKANFSFTQR